ncbi:MAG: IS4 family transposase [Chryseobacterium sp.]|nr:MAG: IS4 family transposase [Chryseobacterium sp.]
MNKSNFFTGQPIFSQLIRFIPKQVIVNAATKYKSDRYCKRFDTYHHLLTMLYACYQHCKSLREVTTGLQASQGRLQSLNMHYLPARSTLAEANQRRTSQVFEQIYFDLLNRYRHFLSDSRFKDPLLKRLIIIDSTTISLFQEILKNAGRPAINGKKKGGIKVHMAVNAHEDVPYLIRLTAAAKADAPFMKELNPPAGSIIVMDRGYNNFHWLNRWQTAKADWITRVRKNSIIETTGQKAVTENDQLGGVLSDQLITLGFKTNKTEQVKCRLIKYYDKESKKEFEFITSNNRFSALKIAMLYKQRWQIETLFKRLKQNMPLEYFLGDNENAISIQIWCALIADLLLKVVQSRLKRTWAFSNMASFIRLHLMNYTHIFKFLENPEKCKIYNPIPDLQLKLSLYG